MPTPERGRRVRVALDLLGGDAAPGVVADAAALVHREEPDVDLVLVGPSEETRRLLAARDLDGRLRRLKIVDAAHGVTMGEDPLAAVRAPVAPSVRVAAELVRAGDADALVSAGPTGASVAASVLHLGRWPGVARPALAALVPAATGSVVLLDVGAAPTVGAAVLARHAELGAAYATALGAHDPRVGLLSIGAEPGKGDDLRRAAHALIAELPLRFVGNVEGGDVCRGERADVVVTDGFTGNVLLKGMEAAARLAVDRLLSVTGASGSTGALAALAARVEPERQGGGVLLGVAGTCVICHGGSGPVALAAGVVLAARLARDRTIEVAARLHRPVEPPQHDPRPRMTSESW